MESREFGGLSIKKSLDIGFSSEFKKIRKDLKYNYSLYLLAIPVLLYYLIFCYIPMGGIMIAFKDFTIRLDRSFIASMFESRWIGFKYFVEFFNSAYFSRIIINTIRISFLSIVFSFPVPIILALLINEVKNERYKRVVQTITYMPHFISLVVICGIINTFVSETGFISNIIAKITGTEAVSLLTNAKMFLPIYILSDIWQTAGWGSIVYLAALAGVNYELYEAAFIDGAGRWKQTVHVTLPAIIPTIAIMLILRLGSVLSVGFEKILLLYNPLTKPVADVISTYVYEKGLINRDYSFSTAVGLFNSVVNIIFLIAANKLSGKIFETALW